MILDIIVVLFILMLGLIYEKKGFVIAVFEFASIFVALIVAFLLWPFMAVILKSTPIDEHMISGIASFVSELNLSDSLQVATQQLFETVGTLPVSLLEETVDKVNMQLSLGILNSAEYIGIVVSDFVINALAFFLTFIIIKLFLYILRVILSTLTQLPLIKSVNRLGGLGLGLMLGAFWVWIFCLMIPFIITNPATEWFTEMFESSVITKWLYENNLIATYLSTL